MHPQNPPDSTPAEIAYPGNLVENSGNPLQTGVFDYTPFGMQMPDRSYIATNLGYRFGFQSQEKDDEIKGEGNSINYKYRMHDPRIGRFFSIDPLAKEYPFYSPYAFSGNRVIDMVEQEGLQPIPSIASEQEMLRRSKISITEARQIEKQQGIQALIGMGFVIDITLTRGKITKEFAKNILGQYCIHVATELLVNGNKKSNNEILTNATKKIDFFAAGFDAAFQTNDAIAKFAKLIIISGIDITPDGFSSIADGSKETGELMYDFVGNIIAEKVGLSTGKYSDIIKAGVEVVLNLRKEYETNIKVDIEEE